MQDRSNTGQQTLGVGGGCHWCTEAVFLVLDGVSKVEQGYIASEEPHCAYSEAVIVHYDPKRLRLADLIQVHLATHSSRSDHSLRWKYRSAVYFSDTGLKADIEEVLQDLQPHVTQALFLKDFRPSEKRYHSYFYRFPDKPFTRCHIRPKLKLLSERFPDLLKRSNLLRQKLEGMPEGYSERTLRGTRYGVTKKTHNNGRSLKLYAEQLGGSNVVSCNLYITSRGEFLKPCEMPLKKVFDFVLESTVARPQGPAFESGGEIDFVEPSPHH